MYSKKAILVVSFGTSYHDTRKKTIEKIEEDLDNAFPEHTLKRAFTSQMIMNKLKKRDGINIDNPREALDKLLEEGYEELLVQPTHIINGSEYEGLWKILQSYKDKFREIKFGTPLLTDIEDYEKVVKIMATILPEDMANKGIIMMGHGSSHYSNSAYPCLDYYFKNEGYKNIHIATVEGFPSLENVINNIVELKYKEIILIPLMIVAGDHIQEDMVGDDDDSWKNILLEKGYSVSSKIIGMGEIQGIRDLYVEHAKLAKILC